VRDDTGVARERWSRLRLKLLQYAIDKAKASVARERWSRLRLKQRYLPCMDYANVRGKGAVVSPEIETRIYHLLTTLTRLWQGSGGLA